MASQDRQPMMALLKEIADDLGADLQIVERGDGGYLTALELEDVIEGFPVEAIACQVGGEDGLEQAATWLLGQIALEGLDDDIRSTSSWALDESASSPCCLCGTSAASSVDESADARRAKRSEAALLSSALTLSVFASDVASGQIEATELTHRLSDLSDRLASFVVSGETAQ